MQITAHNDGCFYKIHSDAGSAKTAARELTYVYSFYRQPKAFTGGELKLYDTKMSNQFTQQDNTKIVEPRSNSIVFFNSRCKHEVLPIICSSRKFEDSRFALNGWLRRSTDNFELKIFTINKNNDKIKDYCLKNVAINLVLFNGF